jgi:hypothetical protein
MQVKSQVCASSTAKRLARSGDPGRRAVCCTPADLGAHLGCSRRLCDGSLIVIVIATAFASWWRCEGPNCSVCCGPQCTARKAPTCPCSSLWEGECLLDASGVSSTPACLRLFSLLELHVFAHEEARIGPSHLPLSVPMEGGRSIECISTRAVSVRASDSLRYIAGAHTHTL